MFGGEEVVGVCGEFDRELGSFSGALEAEHGVEVWGGASELAFEGGDVCFVGDVGCFGDEGPGVVELPDVVDADHASGFTGAVYFETGGHDVGAVVVWDEVGAEVASVLVGVPGGVESESDAALSVIVELETGFDIRDWVYAEE